VYCDRENISLFASKWYMTGDASPAARAWVDGFLAGNEPRPEDLAGPDIHNLDDDDERWGQWRTAVREFRRTGLDRWPDWWSPGPLPASAPLAVGVWCLRGCQVWQWADGTWSYTRPQPDLDWRYLPGSVCAQREDHAPVPLAPDDDREVCRDCGFLEPDH